jgi:hypothetical protein
MTRKIFSVLLTLCAVFLLASAAAAQLRCFARTADAAEFHQPVGASAFPASLLEQMQEELLVTGAAARTERVWTAAGKGGSASIIYTDRYYPSIYPLNMKYGGFWTTEGAVISDRLAKELFLSENCIGAELQLANGTVTITGVYAAGSDFLSKAVPSADLFLPLNSSDAAEMVAFSGSEPASYYLSIIPSNARSRLSGWTALRLYPERNLLLLMDQWLLLASWAIFTGLFAGWLGRRGRLLQKEMGGELQQSYWEKALWQKKWQWLPMLFAVICWLVLTVFVIKIVLIQLPLPTDAVIENVFSLSSWTDFLAGRVTFPSRLANPTLGCAVTRNCWTAVQSVIGILSAALLLAVGKLCRKLQKQAIKAINLTERRPLL